MPYTIIWKCEEVRNKTGTLLTEENTEVYPLDTDYGPTTEIYRTRMSTNVVAFDTYEDADRFAKSWEGHPWFNKLKRTGYRIVQVEPIYKQVIIGYQEIRPY